MAANNIYLQVTMNSAGAQQNVNALNTAIGQLGPTAQKTSQQASAGFARVGVSINQVNREFQQLTSALAGMGIVRGIASLIQISSEMSRIKLGMEAFTGSAEEANKVFNDIRKVAATSPFGLKDLEQAGRRLLGFGMIAKDVAITVKAISDQVTRMGGEIEDVDTIVNLFGRIMEKNFVGAMDLMRALPAKGVPVMKSLIDAMSKQAKRLLDEEDVKSAIKEGLLNPINTIRIAVAAMAGDTEKATKDPARAFKVLADDIMGAAKALVDPEGFGPAISEVVQEVGTLLTPLAGLMKLMVALPPETKKLVVVIVAVTAAVVALGAALGVLVPLFTPLFNLIRMLSSLALTLGRVALAFAVANPAIVLLVAALGLLLTLLYQFTPAFKRFVDSTGAWLAKISGWEKLKSIFSDITKGGKEMMDAISKPPAGEDPLDPKEVKKKYDELLEIQQKHGNEASKILLESLASPVQAVQAKYATLFQELEKEIKDKFIGVVPGLAESLRATLRGAETTEMAAAAFKELQKQKDEQTRHDVETAKAATDAQVEYVEAQDAQSLRGKIEAIDQITRLHIEGSQRVAEIEKAALDDQFQKTKEMVELHAADFAAQGIDVADVIAVHQAELDRQRAYAGQKALDDEQKFRLAGWKKANDLIIEDQKRVYDAFKDQFSQLFDVFTEKTKSLGQALGDFFKKMVLGEARELFSSTMAGAATEAAGYGRPEEGIARGGQGILGILFRRGMPPRPPLAPPEAQGISAPVTNFRVATDAYSDSTVRFAQAVNDFATAAGSGQGGADRSMPDSDAFSTASEATGVAQPLLRAVAQTESGMNPLAVSPKGAMGLMQLMPRTAAGLGVTDAFDAGQNVMGGAQHLQMLLGRYGGDVPKALAAYNMGAAALDRRLASGQPLPVETQNYVQRVMGQMAAAPESATTTTGFTGPDVIHMYPTPTFSATGYGAADVAGGGSGGVGLGSIYAGGGGVPAASGGGGVGLGSILKAGGATTGSAQTSALKTLTGLNPAKLGEFFGIGKGFTSLGSIAGSKGVAGIAGIAGMALLSQGLQKRNAPITVAGGALSGVGAAPMLGFSPLGGALLGAGAGLFAAGVQKGGGVGLGMDVAGGALSGALIGLRFGGPLGAAIGAGIGAAAGAITGTVRLFVKTEAERIRAGIKQVYGIDITNASIIKQIQTIVDQKYGGSVTIGIRSQDVQDIVRLYALSTGQAANLPRPMYSATIAESQAGGLATQPVYQGGVLVQNPYTGPTTYQYQTAVTAAQGLMAGTSLGTPGAGGQVGSIFMQLNPQQANDLFTGKVVQAVQQNPSAVASANSTATRAGDSRVSQAANMLEPLTSLG